MQIICPLLNIFILLLFARVILSWFPISEHSPIAPVVSFLYTVTEPVLGPIRRVMPRVGMFDLSPLIVVFGVSILQRAIC